MLEKQTLRAAVLAVLALTFASAAWAQNYVYKFYDGLDGSGNLVATYTGPLLTSTLNGSSIGNALVLNPSGDGVPIDGCPDGIQPTAIQPTIFSYIHTIDYGSGVNSGFELFKDLGGGSEDAGNRMFVFFLASLPTGPGTYNTSPDPPVASFYYACGSLVYSPAGGPQYIKSVTVALSAPNYSCIGFQSPFNVTLLLKQKVQRAIPLQMQLLDGSGNALTSATIAGAAPVVNITYAGVNSSAVDDTSLLDPIGQSSSGNSFSYNATAQTWQYNLSSSPFTASGTYTVTVSTGDATQYSVSPTCTGTFVRK